MSKGKSEATKGWALP